jgi:hypothetical protein
MFQLTLHSTKVSLLIINKYLPLSTKGYFNKWIVKTYLVFLRLCNLYSLGLKYPSVE